MASGHNRATRDNETGIVEARQRHGKARPVFVAVVQADESVVAVRGHHSFGSVGDHIARGQTGVAALLSLGNVVADGRRAKGEAYQTGILTALSNLLGQLVGVHVTQVAV